MNIYDYHTHDMSDTRRSAEGGAAAAAKKCGYAVGVFPAKIMQPTCGWGAVSVSRIPPPSKPNTRRHSYTQLPCAVIRAQTHANMHTDTPTGRARQHAHAYTCTG